MKSKLRNLVEEMQADATEHLKPDGSWDDPHRYINQVLTKLDGPQQRLAFEEDDFDYISEALKTVSPHFYGEKVSLTQFVCVLGNIIEACNELDVIKKALFYGRDNEALDAVVTQGEHRIDCNLLTVGAPDNTVDIIHAVLGIVTEAGEMAEALHKAFNTGTAPSFDGTNLKEEGGDTLWYMALLFRALETDFTTEMQRNIKKLQDKAAGRYKAAQFTATEAIERNVDAERTVLEGADGVHFTGHGMFNKPFPANAFSKGAVVPADGYKANLHNNSELATIKIDMGKEIDAETLRAMMTPKHNSRIELANQLAELHERALQAAEAVAPELKEDIATERVLFRRIVETAGAKIEDGPNEKLTKAFDRHSAMVQSGELKTDYDDLELSKEEREIVKGFADDFANELKAKGIAVGHVEVNIVENKQIGAFDPLPIHANEDEDGNVKF